MMTPQLFVCVRKNVSQNLTRNLATSYVALKNASDPIQQLFLDKLSEYKSKSAGGKLVDPTPEIERELFQ
ncbi:ATP synthase-coupling factor 6, mitochondrial-like [Diaphorina citri]|uniref:ATP synthase-coupling factor 6, mitochondrial-like n=1 Tax=Diaphorina citri TaxID=121845 RepID=A0A3Q0IP69_DIACI|nr:ATP synthase-coupling factor 6, mitochondrial-like [Diaphorina citri]